MELSFLGAAGTVTGSRTLVSGAGGRLLVDCGMFQGYKALRERNWEPLPLRGRDVDAVLLTHAHLDHSGWVPALVSRGYRGPIYCTPGTADLLGVLLPDAGRIQEEDAAYANRKGYAKHDPALPLYTEADAERALRQIVRVPWGEPVEVAGFVADWSPVGHILGAGCLRLKDDTTSVLFSGDLGRARDLVMKPPAPPLSAEHLVLESTYGGRTHEDHDLMEALAPVVERTVARGGVLLIPSFAVGRAQAVLWALHRLREAGRLPDVPVVLDSPMAVDATELYLRHGSELRLDPGDVAEMCRASRFVQTQLESKALNHRPGPFILVSASGMLTGGRVLHHLAARAPKRENTLLFVGYQSPGTRGARIVSGERDLKLHGRYVEVRCEVTSIDGFSAHADQGELVDWLRDFDKPPRVVWLNHGEPESADALRVRIREELGWDARVAVEGRTVRLPLGTDETLAPRTRRRGASPWRALDDRAQGPLRYVLEHAAVEAALDADRVEDLLVVLGTPLAMEGPNGADAVGLSARTLPAWCWARAAELGRLLAEEAPGLTVATPEAAGVGEAVRVAVYDGGGRTLYIGPQADPSPRGVDRAMSLQASDRALVAQVLSGRAKAVVAFPGGVETLAPLLDLLDRPRPNGDLPVVLVGGDWWDGVLDLDPVGAAELDDRGSGRIFRVADARAAWAALAPLLMPEE